MKLLALLITSCPLWAANIAPVAHATSSAPTANSTTTDAVDTTGANLCILSTTQFTVGGVSDSKGNTPWIKLTTQTISSSSTALYYFLNPVVGSGHTFTVAGGAAFAGVTVECFSGVKTSSPVDTETGNTATGTTIKPGSVSPSENGELIVTGFGNTNTITTSTIGIDSSFTITDKLAYNVATNYGAAMAYIIQGVKTSVDPQWSWTGSVAVASPIALFKAETPPVYNSIRHRVTQ